MRLIRKKEIEEDPRDSYMSPELIDYLQNSSLNFDEEHVQKDNVFSVGIIILKMVYCSNITDEICTVTDRERKIKELMQFKEIEINENMI